MKSTVLCHEEKQFQHARPVTAERQAPEHVGYTSFRGHAVLEAFGVVVHSLFVNADGVLEWAYLEALLCKPRRCNQLIHAGIKIREQQLANNVHLVGMPGNVSPQR